MVAAVAVEPSVVELLVLVVLVAEAMEAQIQVVLLLVQTVLRIQAAEVEAAEHLAFLL